MRRRFILVLALVAVFVAGPPAWRVFAQPPPRLIADNRTSYYVDVLIWNGTGWNFVSRVSPGTWSQFPNAANGSLWRAVIGQVVRDHRVQYVYDSGYGGYQDVWWIQ